MDIQSNIQAQCFILFFLLLLLFFCSNCPICLQIAGGIFLFDILTYCRHTQTPLCRFCCGWNHFVSPRGWGRICIVRLESISTAPFPGLSNTQCGTECACEKKKDVCTYGFLEKFFSHGNEFFDSPQIMNHDHNVVFFFFNFFPKKRMHFLHWVTLLLYFVVHFGIRSDCI